MKRDELIRFERALLDTFPPLETENVGGLALGAARGVTRRANSACSLGEPVDNPIESMDAVETWYSERDLVPTVRVSPLTPMELIDELDRRGYLVGERDFAGTLAMGRVRLQPVERPTAPRIEIEAERPSDWATLSDRSPIEEAVIADMLRGVNGSTGWAVIRDGDGSPLSVGRAVVADGLVCLQALATRPENQRQGLASGIVAALHEWGIDRGARQAMLHVLSTNPATALYERLGYRRLYEYHYRVSAGPSRSQRLPSRSRKTAKRP